jgi:hypothetical protein
MIGRNLYRLIYAVVFIVGTIVYYSVPHDGTHLYVLLAVGVVVFTIEILKEEKDPHEPGRRGGGW